MKITTTNHCDNRMLQRGRSETDLRIIVKYGQRIMGSCTNRLMYLVCGKDVNSKIHLLRLWLNKHSSAQFQERAKKVRAIIRLLDRAVNWLVVVEQEKTVRVITVYPVSKNKRRQLLPDTDFHQSTKRR